MSIDQSKTGWQERRATVRRLAIVCIGTIAAGLGACYYPCGSFFRVGLVLRGIVVDLESPDESTVVSLGGITFTAGERTESAQLFRRLGVPSDPLLDENGTFELEFRVFGNGCWGLLAPPIPPLEFPPPDEVELIVTRDSCEQAWGDLDPDLQACDPIRVECPCSQSFLIEINEQTAAFSEEFSELEGKDVPTIRLIDPIAVSACESCCTLTLVRGIVLDEETRLPLSGVGIGADSLTNGEETQSISTAPAGVRGGVVTAEDGTFQFTFSNAVECPPVVGFPRPDQLEIMIVYGPCWSERELVVEINEDTASFTQLSNEGALVEVIELNEPILVPPCTP